MRNFEQEQIEDCKRALETSGVPPADGLAKYMAALLDWNQHINVTGARSPEELALKHIADVWGAAQVLGKASKELVDVGSGGGIPGIVLGILWPGCKITLVERRQKKAKVLSSIVSDLGREEDIRVVSRSFEEVPKLHGIDEFWFRGFLPGPKLAAYLSEFFPRGDLGQLVLMKGPSWPKEKEEVLSGPKIREVWMERFVGAAELHYALPKGAGERLLVLV